MKLSPSEILAYLGFQIGPEGIEINPVDAFAITTGLRLAGQVLASRLDVIPEDELKGMHDGMNGAAINHGLPQVSGAKEHGLWQQPPAFDADRTRQFVKFALRACGQGKSISADAAAN